ncbi:MAG: TonB-dependent receptor [Elusimicrobiota bacterium]|nr:TonB-dependent receptor [Elusimicrobiota bacterium]
MPEKDKTTTGVSGSVTAINAGWANLKTIKVYAKIFVITIFLSVPIFVGADDDFDLETIVVTGTRIPASFSSATRNVTVIEREDIENAPVRSVPELLSYMLGVDIQERGTYGTQADVSIRGSTFQQTLILVDGIRINDSQTAHHNMDIPVSMTDIERIEILRGQGSSVYGTDAFGGVINIITRTPKSGRFDAEVSGGGDNTRTGLISGSRKWGNFGQSFSAEKKTSDGFQYNTDFEISNFTGKSSFRLPGADFNLLLGVTDKDFGAHNFYGTVIDEERERTIAKFAALNARISLSDRISLEPKLYSRRHDDRFGYDYGSNFYQNEHTTQQNGIDVHILVKLTPQTSLVSGGEFSADKIESSNMGNHSRRRIAPYFEYRTSVFNRLSLDFGMRADYHSAWDRQLSPAAGLGWQIDKNWKLRSAAGRAFRCPSFTELYYLTPSNKGDSSLKPEESISYEIGADYSINRISCGVTVFRRRESNIIDWIKNTPGDAQWLAKNIGRAAVNGAEITAGIKIASLKLSAEYVFIDMDVQKDYISKYALRAPEHQFSSGIEFPLITGWVIKAQSVYKKRPDEDGYFLLSSGISKKLGKFEIFLRGTNLLDVSYQEIIDASSPPRWFGAGIKVKI